jgi:hypothetical protein
MSRNPKNTQEQDNLNNTTNLNNTRDEERTIPEIDRKQEFDELDKLQELSKKDIEGTSSISNSSIFLFLNKLPRWLKALLKYFALYFIGLFIVKVIGYNSNIIQEIYNHSNFYLVWFLKLYCILNLLVIIYFI